ncbi:diacylglycerol kinase family protein [Hanstruepera marina]|uniref:diacylglycerol kinase family protein n=1 Tax=Hanstruepera marina TaxID=2873265 RepID=UPI001CA602EA|nr:diacylglycerol kinase family protein [Hanstruepera marina]
MVKKETFLVNRLKSIKYAFKGAWFLITTEASIKIQVSIGVLLTIAGFYFGLTKMEWVIQCLTIGLIIAVESINTAIEKISDFIHPEKHPKIGLIKDISAGAVFIMAITAIIVGIIIYFPKAF